MLIFVKNLANFVSLPWKLDNPYCHSCHCGLKIQIWQNYPNPWLFLKDKKETRAYQAWCICDVLSCKVVHSLWFLYEPYPQNQMMFKTYAKLDLIQQHRKHCKIRQIPLSTTLWLEPLYLVHPIPQWFKIPDLVH